MRQHYLSKDIIEKSFLEYYAYGHNNEFYLTDSFHNLYGFSDNILKENCKKLKDVAVSLVRAGLIKGAINEFNKSVTVSINGITNEGKAYLHSLNN
jgi:hypothetical protein